MSVSMDSIRHVALWGCMATAVKFWACWETFREREGRERCRCFRWCILLCPYKHAPVQLRPACPSSWAMSPIVTLLGAWLGAAGAAGLVGAAGAVGAGWMLPHLRAVPQQDHSGGWLGQPNTVPIPFHNPHHSCTRLHCVETGVLVIAVWSAWTPSALTSLMSMLFPLHRIHAFVYLPRSSIFPQNCPLLLLLFFPGSQWLLPISQYFPCPQKSVVFFPLNHCAPNTAQARPGGSSSFPRGCWVCRKMCALLL